MWHAQVGELYRSLVGGDSLHGWTHFTLGAEMSSVGVGSCELNVYTLRFSSYEVKYGLL